MLGRLLSGAGMMKAGQLIARRGLQMRAKAKNAPAVAAQGRRAAIINSVREKTRGIVGAKRKDLFSKYTGTGQKRRDAAAAQMKAKRAGFTGGNSLRGLQRARSKAIVNNVKGVTRSIVPADNIAKKATATNFIDRKSRMLNRHHLAQFLKEARKKPTQGYYNRAGETFDFRKKRKFQGPKI